MYYSVSNFLSMFNAMRDLVKEDNYLVETNKTTRKQFMDSKYVTVNKTLAVIFEDENESVTTHIMRKLYACMAYNSLPDTTTVDEFTYVATILGHDLKRLKIHTTLPYLCVRLE
jgi:hypothetical protein